MVAIRNPWGSEKYHGKWGDNDPAWTEALRQEIGATNDKQDGIFHMDIDTFKEKFAELSINMNNTQWDFDYFLRLNDTATNGKNANCGPRCTRHELTVVSDADQTVYLTAHQWHSRAVPDKCQMDRRKGNGVVRTDQDYTLMGRGPTMLKPVTMTKG